MNGLGWREAGNMQQTWLPNSIVELVGLLAVSSNLFGMTGLQSDKIVLPGEIRLRYNEIPVRDRNANRQWKLLRNVWKFILKGWLCCRPWDEIKTLLVDLQHRNIKNLFYWHSEPEEIVDFLQRFTHGSSAPAFKLCEDLSRRSLKEKRSRNASPSRKENRERSPKSQNCLLLCSPESHSKEIRTPLKVSRILFVFIHIVHLVYDM